MDNSRRKLPSVNLVLLAGFVIVILDQSLLLVFRCSMIHHIVRFVLTAGLISLVCIAYCHVVAIVERTQNSLTEMVLRWGELEHTDKLTMAGMLAAGIAHEIRNPLTSLRGFIQLLQSKERQYTDIMLVEVDRINEIVNEMLELAKPKESMFKPGRLQPLLHNVVTLLQAQAILHNVQLICEFETGTEDLVINCNENKLKQVFINIIKNAIEAMPRGGYIVISLSAKNGWSFICMSDNGDGIPEAILERLGEPFLTSKEKGTGLGLMISKRIIEEHNGFITFKSQVNHGTRVTVELPIYKEARGI